MVTNREGRRRAAHLIHDNKATPGEGRSSRRRLRGGRALCRRLDRVRCCAAGSAARLLLVTLFLGKWARTPPMTLPCNAGLLCI